MAGTTTPGIMESSECGMASYLKKIEAFRQVLEKEAVYFAKELEKRGLQETAPALAGSGEDREVILKHRIYRSLVEVTGKMPGMLDAGDKNDFNRKRTEVLGELIGNAKSYATLLGEDPQGRVNEIEGLLKEATIYVGVFRRLVY